ncbi:MAG: polyketide biosynthesis methyltransferase [Gammaproteobacteria bacterium]|nr:MAG: polyketide biosynthesis methyltransferase [Gammaproteobacteria bacterium]
MIKDKSPVSLTGHFTGQVWCENGYSPREMGSLLGRVLYRIHRPAGWLNERLAGHSLETILLARHHLIDNLVCDSIEQNGVTQIVEMASGLSGRGLRMLHRYPEQITTYLEADLPPMVAWKNRKLQNYCYRDKRHIVAPVNILRSEGRLSPAGVFKQNIDPGQNTLVITEGLVNYFQLDTIEAFWRRLQQLLNNYPAGIYLFEVWPELAIYREKIHYRGLLKIIEWLTRQQVPLHYHSDESIVQGVEACGYHSAQIYSPDISAFGMNQRNKTNISPFRVVKAMA